MPEINENTVNGFIFMNKRDMERAKREKETIDRINETLSSNDIDAILGLYRKAVSKRYFVTPVGLSYLSQVRQYLVENGRGDELPMIPVIPIKPGVSEEALEEVKSELKSCNEELDKQLLIKNKLIVAVVALLVCVIGMIFIVATSDNQGFINAEEKVLNKYSAWEEDLKEREALIREKEEALK